MSKYFLTFSICALTAALLLFFYFSSSKQKIFSCAAKYNVTQYMNNNTLLSQGLLSAEFTGDDFLINFEGLLTSNDKNYIVSRNIDLKLKQYSNSQYLYNITEVKVILKAHDNLPEDIAQQSLFGSLTNDGIIYIDRINEDTILFGNQILSQYGCKRT